MLPPASEWAAMGAHLSHEQAEAIVTRYRLRERPRPLCRCGALLLRWLPDGPPALWPAEVWRLVAAHWATLDALCRCGQAVDCASDCAGKRALADRAAPSQKTSRR